MSEIGWHDSLAAAKEQAEREGKIALSYIWAPG